MNREQARRLAMDYVYGEMASADAAAFEDLLPDVPELADELEKLNRMLTAYRSSPAFEKPQSAARDVLDLLGRKRPSIVAAVSVPQSQLLKRKAPKLDLVQTEIPIEPVVTGDIKKPDADVNEKEMPAEIEEASKIEAELLRPESVPEIESKSGEPEIPSPVPEPIGAEGVGIIESGEVRTPPPVIDEEPAQPAEDEPVACQDQQEMNDSEMSVVSFGGSMKAMEVQADAPEEPEHVSASDFVSDNSNDPKSVYEYSMSDRAPETDSGFDLVEEETLSEVASDSEAAGSAAKTLESTRVIVSEDENRGISADETSVCSKQMMPHYSESRAENGGSDVENAPRQMPATHFYGVDHLEDCDDGFHSPDSLGSEQKHEHAGGAGWLRIAAVLAIALTLGAILPQTREFFRAKQMTGDTWAGSSAEQAQVQSSLKDSSLSERSARSLTTADSGTDAGGLLVPPPNELETLAKDSSKRNQKSAFVRPDLSSSQEPASTAASAPASSALPPMPASVTEEKRTAPSAFDELAEPSEVVSDKIIAAKPDAMLSDEPEKERSAAISLPEGSSADTLSSANEPFLAQVDHEVLRDRVSSAVTAPVKNRSELSVSAGEDNAEPVARLVLEAHSRKNNKADEDVKVDTGEILDVSAAEVNDENVDSKSELESEPQAEPVLAATPKQAEESVSELSEELPRLAKVTTPSSPTETVGKQADADTAMSDAEMEKKDQIQNLDKLVNMQEDSAMFLPPPALSEFTAEKEQKSPDDVGDSAETSSPVRKTPPPAEVAMSSTSVPCVPLTPPKSDSRLSRPESSASGENTLTFSSTEQDVFDEQNAAVFDQIQQILSDARHYQAYGSFSRAVAAVNRALRLKPTPAQAADLLTLKSECLLKLREFDPMDETIRALRQVDPEAAHHVLDAYSAALMQADQEDQASQTACSRQESVSSAPIRRNAKEPVSHTQAVVSTKDDSVARMYLDPSDDGTRQRSASSEAEDDEEEEIKKEGLVSKLKSFLFGSDDSDSAADRNNSSTRTPSRRSSVWNPTTDSYDRDE